MALHSVSLQQVCSWYQDACRSEGVSNESLLVIAAVMGKFQNFVRENDLEFVRGVLVEDSEKVLHWRDGGDPFNAGRCPKCRREDRQRELKPVDGHWRFKCLHCGAKYSPLFNYSIRRS